MDHAHYRYSALPLRSAAPLPAGLHVFVVLYLEHWDFEAPPGSLRDPRFVGEFGSFNPDYRSWSQREYGLRIGVFRLLDALRQEAIVPSVAANSLVLPRLPTLIGSLRDLGASWLGHGVAATRLMHSDMPLQEQSEQIQSSLEALRREAGPAQGWLSQDWGSSVHTFGLLADAGLKYTLDWGNDDQPYWLEPAGQSARRLLALPSQANGTMCRPSGCATLNRPSMPYKFCKRPDTWPTSASVTSAAPCSAWACTPGSGACPAASPICADCWRRCANSLA